MGHGDQAAFPVGQVGLECPESQNTYRPGQQFKGDVRFDFSEGHTELMLGNLLDPQCMTEAPLLSESLKDFLMTVPEGAGKQALEGTEEIVVDGKQSIVAAVGQNAQEWVAFDLGGQRRFMWAYAVDREKNVAINR